MQAVRKHLERLAVGAVSLAGISVVAWILFILPPGISIAILVSVGSLLCAYLLGFAIEEERKL